MSRVLTNEQNYYNIADTIRQMKNVNTTYKPRQMASALKDIYSNEVEGILPLSFEANGNNLLDYRIDGASGGVGERTKNLLQNNATSQTKNGVTFTVNEDKSITCNGTVEKTTQYVISDNTIYENCVLSGCPSGGGYNNYLLRFRGTGGEQIAETGSGKPISNVEGYVEIRLNTGYTCDNLTFYPMIRLASIQDDTYEPYGYKVPVVCGGTTTNIYLDEPIDGRANIPSEYTEVEYIESTGTQYINTNIIPTDTTGVEAKISICNDNNRDNVFMGRRESSSSDSRYWIDVDWTGSKAIIFGFNSNTNVNDRYFLKGSDVGKSFIISMNYMNDRTGKINGITYDTSISSKTLVSMSKPMYIFAGNRSGYAAYQYSGKLYNLKITDGTNVIKNFIPCYRKSDNVAGLYDLVNNAFYTNQGTGNFIVGPIKENESISLSDTNVDIPTIEGTNTLTIDTTVQPSNVYVQAPKDSEEIVYLTTILEEEI